jgi:hypothetical protein
VMPSLNRLPPGLYHAFDHALLPQHIWPNPIKQIRCDGGSDLVFPILGKLAIPFPIVEENSHEICGRLSVLTENVGEGRKGGIRCIPIDFFRVLAPLNSSCIKSECFFL